MKASATVLIAEKNSFSVNNTQILMNIDQLTEAINTASPRIIAFVTSQAASDKIRKMAMTPGVEMKKDTNASFPRLAGTPIHAFSDVPDKDMVAFYEHETLKVYLQYRDQYGHESALNIARILTHNPEPFTEPYKPHGTNH